MFSKLTVVAILAASVFAAQQCSRTYTVQAGDDCDTIGAANNASTYQIMVVNYPNIDAECTNLNPSAQLCLGYVGEDCQSTYVVQLGDTCDQVSSNHGINNTILYQNNPQIDSECHNIYVGEVLCVANQVQVTPPTGVVPTSIPSTATAATAAETSGASEDEDLPYCDEL